MLTIFHSNVYRFKFITRIIKSLGELGYERFQLPWVTFLIEEVIVHKMLPNVDDLSIKFWINAIKDDDDMNECLEHYKSLTKGPNALKRKHYGNLGNVEILSMTQMTEINSPDQRIIGNYVKDCDYDKGKGNHTSEVDINETSDKEEETNSDIENMLNSTEEMLKSVNVDLRDEMVNQFDCLAKKMKKLN